MKDSVLLLLCAVTLAHSFKPEANQNVRSCNCDPSEAQQICEANFGNDNVLIAHENCDKFYSCTNGKPVAYRCPNNLLYNPFDEVCDWPQNVECGDRPISDGTDDDDPDCEDNVSSAPDNDGGGDNNEGTCNCDPSEAPSICTAQGSNGILVAHENCNQFYMCAEGRPVSFVCGPNLLYNPYIQACDWPQNVECGDRVIPEPDDNDTDNDNGNEDNGNGDGTCNCNPEEAPAICAAADSGGVLVAHENCNQFYICDAGKPIAVTCAGTLLYNPYTEQCDWPRNVDCGDRVVPESGGCSMCNESNESDDPGNDTDDIDAMPPPGDNPGSDNDDIDAVPPPGDDAGNDNDDIDAVPPPGDDLGNDNDDIDAVPPPGDDTGNDNDDIDAVPPPGDDPGIDNDDIDVVPPPGDDTGNDNDGSVTEGGGNDNIGAGNCDPSEAPTICAADDSEDILVAHENCNQFYICNDGKPVALQCPGNLLFNPNKDQCDWPHNVDCGDRVIPDIEEDGNNNSPGGDNDGNDNGGNDNGNGDNEDIGTVSPPGEDAGNDNGGNDNENGDNDNIGAGNCDPSEAPTICAADDSEDILVAHENCNQFYICNDGKPVALQCPGNLLFNPNKDQCDWPHNVDCGDRVIPDVEDDINDIPGSDSDGNDNDGNDNGGNDNGNGDNEDTGTVSPPGDDAGNDNGGNDNENGDNDNVGAGNCDPSEAPTICAADDSEDILVAHENCNQFYICNDGKPVALQCPGNLLFNPNKDQCDWPHNVDCGDRVIPDIEEDGNNNSPGGDNDGNDNGGNDNGNGDNEDIGTVSPPGEDAGNDNGGNDNENGDNDNIGAGNCDPSEAPTICAADDSEDILVAHENCNQFYICNDGKPVALQCPGNLLFNPNKDQCDWPHNVDCGDRVIPDIEEDGNNNSPGGDNDGNDNGGNDNGNGDNEDIGTVSPPGEDAGNDNGGNDNENGDNDNIGAGNCDPSEAPTICAADDSEDILVAHENCNQFYICNDGKPVALQCPGNLLFNPNKDQCDWPHNVDCGDRVIPDIEEDGNNNSPGGDNDGNDNGGNDNGNGDNEDIGTVSPPGEDAGNDNGGNDNENGDNDNIGAGNCDPSEAPTICAADDSEDILVAHENCNQFYICNDGKPVALQCPGNLLFNPNKDQCDWPHNVDCGDRVIPDVEDDINDIPGSDSDGNDNDGNDNGGNDNGNGDNEDTGTVSPPGDDAGNDNGGNDNENGDNDNVGAGNCDPSEAPTICAADDSEDILVAHENCNQFYICNDGKPVALQCPGNLLFNPNKDQCDWPHNVDCGDRVIPDIEEDGNNNSPGGDNDGNDNGGNDNGNGDNEDIGTVSPPGEDAGNDNGGNDNENGDNDNIGAGNCDPSEAPTICAADDSEDILVAHENCNQFYICNDGKPVALQCPGNLLFNPNKDQCDWPHNVDCGDRVIPDIEEDGNNNSPGGDNDGNDNGGNDNGNGDNEDIGTVSPPGEDAGNDNGGNDNENGDNDNIGAGNCDPSEAPTICAADDSEDILVAHENCNQFYICNDGKPVALQCPGNLLFNPNKDQCDWPHNVDCGDRVIPDVEDDINDIPGSDSDGNDNDGNDNGGNDNGNGDNEDTGTVSPPGDDAGNDNGGNDNENGDNDNVGAGNCDPSEAPTICAADDSEDILVAHESCNQFYICNDGKPVALQCPGNLLFNPNKDQCDWPHNVDCGDRVIPDIEEDGNNNSPGGDNDGNDNGGNDNGNGDNEDIGTVSPPGEDAGNDNGGNDNENGDNDNVGAGNCDPSEAPTICAADDSEGVLVAHENCNQFYICNGGKPVVLQCPGNLLFNPNKDQCDWPHNVDCGDRVIPDVEEDGNNNSPDSDSDDNNNGGNDNGNGDNEDTGTVSPPGDDAGNDNGGNDNENGDNDNVGAGNCDPSEAPTICAADDSEGVLVAHENCNQFYICNGGKPVALLCPGNLLFNPNKDQCDWPHNVDCGDRVIPDVEEDLPPGGDDVGDDSGSNDDLPPGGDDAGNDSGSIDDLPPGGDDAGNDSGSIDDLPPGGDDAGNDSGSIDDLPPGGDDAGNDSGSIDDLPPGGDDAGNDSGNIENSTPGCDEDDGNDDNVSDCNCKPDEASSICAVNGSDGVLVAHNYCNHFYTCSNGKPVVFKCPPNLLYNPHTEQCDWPFNVECGDRVIPDPEDDIDSEDVEEDDIENDNGTCNCSPEEAPAICEAAGSDGVLVAHEHCNRFYQCSTGKPVAITCPTNLLYNPYKEVCDWPQNVDCGDRVIPDPEEDTDNNDTDDNDTDDNDSGIVNDDPSQAPSICAESGSSGVLVAHENCEQFYMCSGGLPVTLSCAGELLYNPITQQCDWPNNVDCGDRIVPESDDNCACNPRNAPSLCSRPDSNGKMIAHENCNQFYVCAEGVPQAFYCADNLQYNIDKEVCDWPQNVDCNNRMLTYASLNKHFESRQALKK